MRYKFPIIQTIDDVLPHLDDNFHVTKKDGYTVVGYHNSSIEVFPEVTSTILGADTSSGLATTWEYSRPAAIRRECRGLIFGEDGKLISRRLHKFFNMGERLETLEGNLEEKDQLVAYEKLDGSMITPLFLKTGLRWASKGGVTDVSMQAETWVVSHLHYERFARFCNLWDTTPIFEWCSRKQKIVVDHPEDRLVLLAIRKTETGAYVSYNEMYKWANDYGVEVVKQVIGSWHEVREALKDNTTDEGVVLTYPDGHRVKVKTDWYVKLHRVKDECSRERDVLNLILMEKLDDIKPLLTPEDLDRVDNFQISIERSIKTTTNYLEIVWESVKEMTKKDFACSEDGKHVQDVVHKSILFKMFDNPEAKIKDLVLDKVRRIANTRHDYEKRIREFLCFKFDWKGQQNDEDAF